MLTKREILLGKGTRVESSLGFYGDGISFWVVFGQSF